MASPEKRAESAATHAADAHLAERKKRTSRRFGRAVGWFAASLAAFAVAAGTVVFPPVSAAFALAGLGSVVIGAGYTVGGIASGISNALSRA